MVPRLLPALALLLTASALAAPGLTGPATLASDPPALPCTLPTDFVAVDGAGPSCFTDGSWLIRLGSGEIVRTHGPDHLPDDHQLDQAFGDDPADEGQTPGAGGPVGDSSTWRAPARAAICVSDESTEKHGVILYTRPYDKLDTYADWLDRIRHMFYLSNGLLRDAGDEDGISYGFKMACDADGRPRVENVVLPTSRYEDTFWSIVNDVSAQGHDKSNVKYWIWHYDGINCGGCSGWGTIPGGDAPSETNRNNGGPAWGVTFVRDSMLTFMHENGHNMGAVQHSAPHSTGGWHCNDGTDVMCYADDGYKQQYSSRVCPGTLRYDCGQDDYFDPTPAAGSYLDTHWNVAASYNHFLERVPLADLPSAPRDLMATHLPGGTVQLTWSAPVDPGASAVTKYSIYRGPCLARIGANIASIGQVETFLTRTSGAGYTDTLPENGHWSYYVAAVNAQGEGALSRQAVAVEPGALQPIQVTRCYVASGP